MAAVTVLTMFEVSGSTIDQLIDEQDNFEDFVASQEGFINHKFLRSQTGSDKYNIVSVSEWESKESFVTAFSKPELVAGFAEHPEFVFHRAFYDTVRSV